MGEISILPANPEKKDPYYNNVSLLLRGNGSNGSTNFIDSSKNNLPVTPNGNVQISTIQSKFGGSSILFDGANDYLDVTGLPNNYLNQNFTIEGWVWIDSSKNAHTFFNAFPYRTLLISLNRFGDGHTHVFFGDGNIFNGSFSSTLFSPLLLNQWQYFALVNNNNIMTIYHNGISVGFGSLINISNYLSNSRIGATTFIMAPDPEEFKGYIDDFKITTGIARYTSSTFTLPNKEVPDIDPTNLKVWLKGDGSLLSQANIVYGWNDDSPVGNYDFTLGIGNVNPLKLNGPNNSALTPAVHFSNNCYLKNAAINFSKYTVIHVSRLYQDNDGEGRIFSSMNTNALIGSWNNYSDRMFAGSWVYQGTSTSYDWKITVGTVDLENYKSSFRQNGQNLASNINAAIALDGVSIGGWEYFGGIYELCQCDVAEVIIYDRVLTEKEIRKIEQYLNNKYKLYQDNYVFNKITASRQTNNLPTGELLAYLGNDLIIEDIINSRDVVLGQMQVDVANGYRTIFTLDGTDRVVRNEILQSNNIINYNLGYMPRTFTATFDIKTGGGGGVAGADGIYFYFFADIGTGGTPSGFPNGKYMGGGTTGTGANSYRVHFDEYTTENQQLAISWNGYFNLGLGSQGSGGVLIGTVGGGLQNPSPLGFSFGDNTWRSVKIQFQNGLFNIYIDNTLRLTATDTNYNSRNLSNFNFGLGGYVGGLNNFHYFKNFKLYGRII